MLDEKILKKKIIAALEPKRLTAAPVRAGPAARPAGDDRGVPHLRPPPRAVHRRHRRARLARARRPTASCSSRAPRARCSTSTTAPIRSSPRRTRSPAPRASAPASARATSTRSGASPRPTRRASAPGPFPTELHDEIGEEIRERGGEFGTTTGRPRRTGWLDLVALQVRRAAELADRARHHQARRPQRLRPPARSARATAATDEATSTTFPYHQSVLHHAVGEYVELPGWSEDISECRAARTTCPRPRATTCEFIADFIGVPIVLVGVGPGREQIDLDRRPPAGRARGVAHRTASARSSPRRRGVAPDCRQTV